MATSDDIFDENDLNEDTFSDDSLFDESFEPDDLPANMDEGDESWGEEEIPPEGGATEGEPAEEWAGLPEEEPEEKRPDKPEKKRPEVLWPYGTKRNLFLTSLVAALPAAVLAFLMIKAFLSYTEKMNVKLMTLAGITLFTSAVVALTPAGILVFAPKEAEKPPTEPTKKKKKKREEEEGEREEPEGFGDVIPEDFDESEIASATVEEGDEIEPLDLDLGEADVGTDELTFDDDFFLEDEEKSS